MANKNQIYENETHSTNKMIDTEEWSEKYEKET